ncbi:hypothetical protein RRF57_012353 [Xylaria bambusicola]|uniref:Uncharacterized protein n=1 Tax=Xylaria bambusicola TaxID=326684 RepID=A0AAN7V0H3_9PEZI
MPWCSGATRSESMSVAAGKLRSIPQVIMMLQKNVCSQYGWLMGVVAINVMPTVKARRASAITTAGPTRCMIKPVVKAAVTPDTMIGLCQAVARRGEAPRSTS